VREFYLCTYKGQDFDLCGLSNEPSGSIKGMEFFDLLSDHQVLKKASALWSEFVSQHLVKYIGIVE
jgi:hypothetical protein